MTLEEFFQDSEKPKYAKVGVYGAAGAGKTRTAVEIAIGLILDKNLKREVAFFDTERGADWVIPIFNKHGIKCHVKKSRSFKDLMMACKVSEDNALSFLIVDSVTHVWRELINAFIEQRNIERRQFQVNKYGEEYTKKVFKKNNKLEFQDWGVVKPMWERFTNFFLSSALNMAVCGREGDMYEYEEKENGKKELMKTGSRMATEKELSYEPSLLINMGRRYVGGKPEIFAVVEKDRSDTINGKEFILPTYEHFKPHFSLIKTEGELKPFSEVKSNDLFEGNTLDPQDEFQQNKRRREVALEKIKAAFDTYLSGQRTDEGKKKKYEILQAVFGTVSWTEIENKPPYVLEQGVDKLNFMFSNTPDQDSK